MKSLFFLVILCSISILSCQQENDLLKIRKAKENSLWKERNSFLNDMIFTNDNYQDTLFKPYEGLWKCVKVKDNRLKTVKYPTNEDFLFAENKIWHLDYPCSMSGYNVDVHLRNDSIFKSTPNRVYIEKKRIGFRGDTLVIFSDRKYDESSFYLKQKFDKDIIEELKQKKFNKQCIQGDWVLTSIGNGASDEWVIEDTYHTHVPRHLNFDSNKIRIDGIYLITSDKTIGKFEILQYTRYFNKENVETGLLYVKELEKREGIEYHYTYELE